MTMKTLFPVLKIFHHIWQQVLDKGVTKKYQRKVPAEVEEHPSIIIFTVGFLFVVLNSDKCASLTDKRGKVSLIYARNVHTIVSVPNSQLRHSSFLFRLTWLVYPVGEWRMISWSLSLPILCGIETLKMFPTEVWEHTLNPLDFTLLYYKNVIYYLIKEPTARSSYPSDSSIVIVIIFECMTTPK